MRQNINELSGVTYLVSTGEGALRMAETTPLPIFSDRVIAFLQELSRRLLTRKMRSPDVATFAFWCRQASMLKEKERYAHCENQRGRGLVFHIAPSNVPINFAFSMAAGLLAGNANIVRVPSKDFEQVTIVCDTISDLLANGFEDLASYLCLVRYPAGHVATGVFSSLCDVRVIWGGDHTIADIRRYPLKPRAADMTFADRFSLAVIDADAYLDTQKKQKIAADFFNDTYFDRSKCLHFAKAGFLAGHG